MFVEQALPTALFVSGYANCKDDFQLFNILVGVDVKGYG